MHTLFPPLDLENDETAADRDEGSVMSKELRENFESMRSLVRAQKRTEADQPLPVAPTDEESEKPSKRKRGSNGCTTSETSARDETNMPGTNNDLQRRKFELAVSTAVAVESELSRLTSGIAELEALLAQQRTGGNQPDAVPFPSLPSIVLDEHQDLTSREETSGGDGNQHYMNESESDEKGAEEDIRSRVK